MSKRKMRIGFILGICVVLCGSFIYYTQVKNRLNQEAVKTDQSSQNSTTQTASSENKPPQSENKADNVQAPQVTITSNTPTVSTQSPQITLDTIRKIQLSMTTVEVKNIIGNEAFENALKAGGNLTALTINIPNTSGGIIIGFEADKVRSINRTYVSKILTKNDISTVKNGMSLKDVIEKLGDPPIENGAIGTVVFVYKYNVGEGDKELIIAFNEQNKVQSIF